MKKRISTALFVLVCLSLIASKSYACLEEPIPEIVSPYEQTVCVGTVVYFDGKGTCDPETGSHDPDNGSPCGCGHGIIIYSWSFGDDSDPDPYPDFFGTPTHTYTIPGEYTVLLNVGDDDWQGSSYPDECTVYVVKVENVTFDPNLLCADGSSTSTASATITPSSRTITWSIQGDALGCSINSSTGVITAGTTAGTITVRAADSVLSDCYAEANIDIDGDCGPSGSCTALSDAEWTDAVSKYPNLVRCNVCKEAPADPDYNCIAWTIGVTDDNIWYQLDEPGPPYYGNDNGYVEVSEFDTFYAYHGVPAILYGTGPGPIYDPKHAAIPLSDNCASSKRGANIRMRHDRNELEGGYYDDIIKTY